MVTDIIAIGPPVTFGIGTISTETSSSPFTISTDTFTLGTSSTQSAFAHGTTGGSSSITSEESTSSAFDSSSSSQSSTNRVLISVGPPNQITTTSSPSDTPSSGVISSQTATTSSLANTPSTSDSVTSVSTTSITSSFVTPITASISSSSNARPSSPQESIPSSVTMTTSTTIMHNSTQKTVYPTSGHQTASNVGVAIGAGIGAGIGAAVLVGLLCFFLWRRMQRSPGVQGSQHSKGRHSYRDRSSRTDQKGLREASYEISAIDPRPVWEKSLPQPADDSSIRQSIKKCFDQIDLHVENFYKNKSIPMSRNTITALQEIDSPHLPNGVVSTLQKTQFPIAVLKHCIVHTIIASISLDAMPETTFLPRNTVLLANAMARQEALGESRPGFSQAISRWRVLTAYLQPPPQTDDQYMSQLDETIRATIFTLSTAFAPWIDTSRSAQAREKSLVAIMRHAADTGILLFSQPSGFSFRWEEDGEFSRGRVVTAPGLVKIMDEEGRMLQRGQVLLQAVLQRV